ncbi:MAG: ABC transporter substrate-binding protein [Thermoanaerobaculia bacterium]
MTRARSQVPGRLARAAALAVALAACGRANDGKAPAPIPAATPVAGGSAVIATITDLGGVNPLITSDIKFTSDILGRFFLQLAIEQADYAEHPPTLRPGLAESWEFSPDHTLLTFHLRPGLAWSDGAPLTAEDVRWTWLAETSPEVAWNYSETKQNISDVEVLDPRTVRFHFRATGVTQLLDAVEGGILPKHLWGTVPFAEWRQRADWFRDHLATSGPFLLAEWKPGEQLVLGRNPRYFEPGLPRLDRVVFRILPDQTAQLEMLLGGQLDFVWGILPRDAERVRQRPGLELLHFDNRQYEYICWNSRRPPFDDPEIRRALTLGIDRQALVDALLRGFGRIATTAILTNVWAYDRDLRPWPYDPAEARRILAARGFRDSDGDGIVERGGKPFSFELTTNSSNQQRIDATVMVQDQLRRIGVEARPRTLEIHTLTRNNVAHDFDATLSGWAIDTSLDLGFAFHSREIDSGYNFGSYRDPELDSLIERSRAVLDPAAGLAIYRRMQEILHRDQPYTFLYEPERLCGVSRSVRDVHPNSLSAYFNLHEWWRSPPPGPAP